MDQSIQYQSFDFALAAAQLFSSDTTVLLSDIGPVVSAGVLSDNDGVIYIGESVTLDGRSVTLIGSGTATPGINLAGLIVPLGTTVDVLVFRDPADGQLYLAYPEGPPNLLSAIAVVLSIDAVGYDTTTDAPLCFCPGTRIDTPNGPRPVETLTPGDLVLTWSDGPQRIVNVLDRTFMAPKPKHRPIVLEADCFGPGKPAHRLRLSPQHRLCLPDSDPAGEEPLLAPALACAVLPKVHHCQTARPVRYIHLELERHYLIRAEGIAAESCLPRQGVRKGPSAPAGRMLTRMQAETLLRAWRVRRDIGLDPAPPARTTTGNRPLGSPPLRLVGRAG